jgi:hypothetical protein
MHNTTLLDIDLRLFDGAAGAAPAGGEGGAAQGDAGATAKAETNGRSGGSRRSRSGATNNVVYGIQGDASGPETTPTPAAGENGQAVSKSGVTTTSNTLEDRRKAFDEMIDGEYKDVFEERFQQAFNRRFKESKGMEQTIATQKPIMDMLMQRYKIADGDVSKLQTAIEQDDRYYIEAADEAGLTVEQYKAMQKLERENAELKLMRQRQQGAEAAQQKLNQWYAQGEKMKELYPSFDFKAEAANKQFTDLLRSGISVQQAYELIHMDEIKAAAARTAAQTAGEQMKARIQNKAARPSENGTSSQSAVITKSDVHSLSRQDRAEIARRAQRGEKIRF